jgi:hypothetical protein
MWVEAEDVMETKETIGKEMERTIARRCGCCGWVGREGG